MNRVATQDDITLYGDYITIGDGIYDTPTKVFSDGVNQLRYTTISKTFPTLREGANLWIDGDKIGPLCEVRFLNGTETTPWSISSASIKPIPNTRINAIYTPNSYGGFLYLFQGLKNLRIEGSSDKYSGLNKFYPSSPFLKGKFGFGATSTGIYQGYHAFSISVLDSGSIYVEGIEGEHGFSTLRVEGGSYDWTTSLEVENFYIHDTSSEGNYIGATHIAPYAKIKDLKIHRGVFARSGSESLQLQHLIGNAHVSNITVFCPDAGYLNQFQPGQDTAKQISPDAGNILIENILTDTWGSHAINCFGSDSVLSPKTTTFRNILLNNGRGEAIYFHPSCKYGMNWNFDNIYIRQPNGEYYRDNKVTKPNWLISANNGTDIINLTNIFCDSSVSTYQNITKLSTWSEQKLQLPEVQYVSSGFYESANRIKYYSQYYAKYITGLDAVPVKYFVGDILQDRQTGKQPIFYKVISDFTASDLTLVGNINCFVLTWDTNGIRNDQVNWLPSTEQKSYPPDDLRVSYGSFYANKNIGFVEEKTFEQLYQESQIKIIDLSSQISELQNKLLQDDTTITGLTFEKDMLSKSLQISQDNYNSFRIDLEDVLNKHS